MNTLEPHFGHLGKERMLTSSCLGSYPQSAHFRVIWRMNSADTHKPCEGRVRYLHSLRAPVFFKSHVHRENLYITLSIFSAVSVKN
jgi:hypothetical protein